MTIIVTTLVPNGIVIAADSRQVSRSVGGQLRVSSDQAQKIYQINSHLAVATCGLSTFYVNEEAPLPVEEIIRREVGQQNKDIHVIDVAKGLHKRLSEYLLKHNNIVAQKEDGVQLFIIGYDSLGDVGKLYRCSITGDVTLERETNDPGVFWCGTGAIIDRLILGCDPLLREQLISSGLLSTTLETDPLYLKKFQLYIDFQTLSLQDAVDLTTILAHTTIHLYGLSNGVIGNPGLFPLCGGVLDIAIITPGDGFKWLKKKSLSPLSVTT